MPLLAQKGCDEMVEGINERRQNDTCMEKIVVEYVFNHILLTLNTALV